MSDPSNQRVPCSKCGAMILPVTAQSNKGLCGQCRRKDAWAEQDRLRMAAEAAAPVVPSPSMAIRVDERQFDMQQLQLIREIVRSIKADLADSRLPEDELENVTGKVAFSVAAIIDGSRVMEANGQPLVPVLAFAEDKERTKLIGRPGGSSMHEYVFGTVDDVFDEDAS